MDTLSFLIPQTARSLLNVGGKSGANAIRVGRVVVVGIAVVVDIAEVSGRVRRLQPPITAITADNRKIGILLPVLLNFGVSFPTSKQAKLAL